MNRNTRRKIKIDQAVGFASYLGGLDDLINGRFPLYVFIWQSLLEEGGPLETLTMGSDKFVHSDGALIPVDVRDALCETAGMTLLESKRLSLSELIIMARQNIDDGLNWPDNVRETVQRMIDRALPRGSKQAILKTILEENDTVTSEASKTQGNGVNTTDWIPVRTGQLKKVLSLAEGSIQRHIREHPRHFQRDPAFQRRDGKPKNGHWLLNPSCPELKSNWRAILGLSVDDNK
ncbi:MAG: hypothetical protein ISQ06_01565 [Planctomycetaceae bacterium]|jgi:hypothetical protein|nr:hypothetical protein [Planctomycetaceae bacterium]